MADRPTTRHDMAELYERVLWNGLLIDAPQVMRVRGLEMVGRTVRVLAAAVQGPLRRDTSLPWPVGIGPLLAR